MGSWLVTSCSQAPPRLLFVDFNENGFIDEEDLQRIVLRLLNSDDMSEDLLTDLTSHVCTCGCTGSGGTGHEPKAWMAGREVP